MTQVTHITAPARMVPYVAYGDTSSLAPEDIAFCDKHLNPDEHGDFFIYEPVSTPSRKNELMACFIFVSG
jgi:hypothetical protein